MIYDSDSTTDDENYDVGAGGNNSHKKETTKKVNQVKIRKEVIHLDEESDSDRTTDGEHDDEEKFELKPTKKGT